MRVDEPGRHDAPGDVQDQPDLVRIDDAEVADGEDPVAEHADVGTSSGTPGAIDDGPAPEEQVEAGHREMMTPGTTRGRGDAAGSPALHRAAGTSPTLCYTPPSVGL